MAVKILEDLRIVESYRNNISLQQSLNFVVK